MAAELHTIANELEHKSVGKLLWQYSFPTIVATLVNALYNIVDRIFVGQEVGAYAISGMALTFPIMMILGAFGMLVSQGAAVQISIALGKKEFDNAKKILANSLILNILIICGAIALIALFLDEILHIFGGTNAIIPYAKNYLRIILAGHLLTSFSLGFNNVLRASGYPIKAMATILIGACLNVLLDYIFIFHFRWGIEGAAVATVISMMITSVWLLAHFTSRKHVLHFEKSAFRLKKSVISPVLAIGFSPFCVQFATSLVNIFMNFTLKNFGGELAIGAFGIVTSFSTLIIMTIVGLTTGMQPIIGYNFGAKKYDRVKIALRLAILISTILTTLGFAVAQIFPETVAKCFTSDETLAAITSRGLQLTMSLFFVVGFQMVVNMFVQSIGKAKTAIFLSITRQIIFLLPLLFLLPKFYQLDGAWLAHAAADMLSAIVAGIALIFVLKR